MNVYLIQVYNQFNRWIIAVVAETECDALRTVHKNLDAEFIAFNPYSVDVLDAIPARIGQFVGVHHEV